MAGRLLECLCGLLLALVTLRDVFDTVVVPGGSAGSLRIAGRLVFVALPLWKRVYRGPLGVGFAPLVLLLSFVIWMCLLILAFGLMAHGLRGSFGPPLTGFGQALYVAGSAMATTGAGSLHITGLASAMTVAAGLCGLAVMTLAVTFLLEVQSGIADRDSFILKLTTTAGEPPSGMGILQRYAELGGRAELRRVLADGRDWCAMVLQSHSTHPSLIYFRSTGTGTGWPAALGALTDLALIFEFLVAEDSMMAPAVLLHRQGMRMAQDLASILDLKPLPAAIDRADLAALRRQIAASGYRLRDAPDEDAFLSCRNTYADCIAALADHLGTPRAPLCGTVRAGRCPRARKD